MILGGERYGHPLLSFVFDEIKFENDGKKCEGFLRMVGASAVLSHDFNNQRPRGALGLGGMMLLLTIKIILQRPHPRALALQL